MGSVEDTRREEEVCVVAGRGSIGSVSSDRVCILPTSSCPEESWVVVDCPLARWSWRRVREMDVGDRGCSTTLLEAGCKGQDDDMFDYDRRVSVREGFCMAPGMTRFLSDKKDC